MGTPDKKLSEFVDRVRSWIPRRTEPVNVSRDFWMPDESCRVCYECDDRFTVFNRRHHCRICGRVFCSKCTANSIPVPSDVECKVGGSGREDCDRVRVCSYCFKQWEQMMADGGGSGGGGGSGSNELSPGLSRTLSATSLVSTKSSCTYNSSGSTGGSTMYPTGPYQHVPYISEGSPSWSSQMDLCDADKDKLASGTSMGCFVEEKDISPDHLSFSLKRADDEDDDYEIHHPNRPVGHFSQDGNSCDAVIIKGIDDVYGPHQPQISEVNVKSQMASPLDYMDSQVAEENEKNLEEVNLNADGDEREPHEYDMKVPDAEPVDFENNGLLWLPPEPEDKDDDREAGIFDEDDDDSGGFAGDWGYLRSSNSFGGGEYRGRDKSIEEHRRAMKNVVEGHFRALASQLLQVENLPAGDQEDQESWLDIVTSLSWEAATLLKPDTSRSGGMDPGGYVKVKCIACGSRSESMVVKGVVCKKNVAHRRMKTKLDKPRVLILGGALEYHRVSNHLSSFDTLLQQEKDHLKMAVAKIDAHHPNVLLVEKSVSRYAQEYLLAKHITLVLNIKRPLLERIARCTGAQIVSSIDHMTSPKLGYCDVFHVERLFEEHGSAAEDGKKLTKTLMFFEGCPKPLGCTVLLKGASGDELKKVKHVLQYGVFAAYHLALETSFLADEGASLPELPLKSPITVALPDNPSSIARSISRIPDFNTANPLRCQSIGEGPKSNMGHMSDTVSATNLAPVHKSESSDSTFTITDPCSWNTLKESGLSSVKPTVSLSPSGQDILDNYCNEESHDHAFAEKNSVDRALYFWGQTSSTDYAAAEDNLIPNFRSLPQAHGESVGNYYFSGNDMGTYNRSTSELELSENSFSHNEDTGSIKEEFLSSPSDNHSILVSLSTRCIWKGTVCEQAHLVRIKYYGRFDKPLGRFLRDMLFDESYRCPSCEMPSEAHIYCYIHREGSLTISVKKFPEFLLPGERDGKIWMWHRCLRCPRLNGFPPTTQRVVMSDAAWGLSFGKFLELSFSNHAAASRAASCGHSLHRDCLRFYGYGRMVACFRYASIYVHSVYLPPAKLEFNFYNPEWIQKEANEVSDRADLLFAEVQTALKRISEKVAVSGSEEAVIKSLPSRCQISELEEMLRREKEEFKEVFRKASKKEVKDGQSGIDILEVNKLRRQMIFHSYIWDQRLKYAVDSCNKCIPENLSSSPPKLKEDSLDLRDKLVDMDGTHTSAKKLSSSDSVLPEKQPNSSLHQGETALQVSYPVGDHHERGGNTGPRLSFSVNSSGDCNIEESKRIVRRSFSEGQFPVVESLSNSLDAAWPGEGNSAKDSSLSSMLALGTPTLVDSIPLKSDVGSCAVDKAGVEAPPSISMAPSVSGLENLETNTSWKGMSLLDFYGSSNKKNFLDTQKLNVNEYNPVYLASFREREWQSGARLLLPVGVNDSVIPVYDDEPTSIISYALVSLDYHAQMAESKRGEESGDLSAQLPVHNSVNLSLQQSLNDGTEMYRSIESSDESILSMSRSRGSLSVDPHFFSMDLHTRVSFTDDGPLGKVKYTVTCYFSKRFEALRRICCPSELDYIRSLSRCKKWGAQGGKSNVFFAKTLDDRFIIKQVTKTELESFIQFAPAYFKYLSESIAMGSPTCLAKVLGVYQVSLKHLKGGKESKMDVLVMENLLFRRNISCLYDLKGSSRSRYNPDTSGSNKVLLDQNLVEAMPTSPIFVGNKAKRLLERAVWNDTSFLASADVMDYSLLVGVDEEKHELVLGIIDFMRQYTWDKHLETWVKTSVILGGPKNAPPTVISPQQYKKRFRKAMTAYFLTVPDQWSVPTIVPSGSKQDLREENSQGGN